MITMATYTCRNVLPSSVALFASCTRGCLWLRHRARPDRARARPEREDFLSWQQQQQRQQQQQQQQQQH